LAKDRGGGVANNNKEICWMENGGYTGDISREFIRENMISYVMFNDNYDRIEYIRIESPCSNKNTVSGFRVILPNKKYSSLDEIIKINNKESELYLGKIDNIDYGSTYPFIEFPDECQLIFNKFDQDPFNLSKNIREMTNLPIVLGVKYGDKGMFLIRGACENRLELYKIISKMKF
jgi:hypothetical protein